MEKLQYSNNINILDLATFVENIRDRDLEGNFDNDYISLSGVDGYQFNYHKDPENGIFFLIKKGDTETALIEDSKIYPVAKDFWEEHKEDLCKRLYPIMEEISVDYRASIVTQAILEVFLSAGKDSAILSKD